MISRITLSVKHSDIASLYADDEPIVEGDYMPAIGIFEGGDYTHLCIDNATGKIIGWTPITQEEIDIFKF
jgi:hypothetical protein